MLVLLAGGVAILAEDAGPLGGEEEGRAAILVGAVDHIGPMGPVAAAVWLGMCWWLY